MNCIEIISPLFPLLVQTIAGLNEDLPRSHMEVYLKALVQDHGVYRAAQIAANKYGIRETLEVIGE